MSCGPVERRAVLSRGSLSRIPAHRQAAGLERLRQRRPGLTTYHQGVSLARLPTPTRWPFFACRGTEMSILWSEFGVLCSHRWGRIDRLTASRRRKCPIRSFAQPRRPVHRLASQPQKPRQRVHWGLRLPWKQAHRWGVASAAPGGARQSRAGRCGDRRQFPGTDPAGHRPPNKGVRQPDDAPCPSCRCRAFRRRTNDRVIPGSHALQAGPPLQ